ncbi:unnamed protein product, partial [marine sediment metagenome]
MGIRKPCRGSEDGIAKQTIAVKNRRPEFCVLVEDSVLKSNNTAEREPS